MLTNSDSLTEDIIIYIDPRSHLEVFDQKHRYAKNLRHYYEIWLKLYQVEDKIKQTSQSLSENDTWNNFFKWLDTPEEHQILNV